MELTWGKVRLIVRLERVEEHAKNKGGRPQKLDKTQVKQIAGLRAQGMTIKEIAERYNVDPRTVQRRLKEEGMT